MKTFLIRSILGIFFGAFLALIAMFAIIYFGEMESLNSNTFVKNSFGAVFCGWFFTVSPLYFENKNMNLQQQTTLHFATSALLYFVLAFVIEWIPFTIISALLNLALFIIVYLIIWTSFYLHFKKEAAKLNAELNDL